MTDFINRYARRPRGRQLAEIFGGAPEEWGRLFGPDSLREMLDACRETRDLGAAQTFSAEKYYGYHLLIDGRRHTPAHHERLCRYFHGHPAAKTIAGITAHYQDCRDWQDWCRRDRELFTELQQCLGNDRAADYRDQAIKLALERFAFFVDRARCCDVLAVVENCRYPELFRHGLRERFLLRHPCPLPLGAEQLEINLGPKFREVVQRVARQVRQWHFMERIGTKTVQIDGRSGGLAIRIAQELALRRLALPPYIGISVALDERGRTAVIAPATVPIKVELAAAHGMRLLYLPDTAAAIVAESAVPVGLELRYLPTDKPVAEIKIYLLPEIMLLYDTVFPLSDQQLGELQHQAIALSHEAASAGRPLDYERALMIFEVMARQTSAAQDRRRRAFHFVALLGMQKIYNHRGLADQADRLAQEAFAKYRDCCAQQQLPAEAWSAWYDAQNSQWVTRMDLFDYAGAEAGLKQIIAEIESDPRGDHYQLGAAYGSLGQLYIFRSELDRNYDERALDCLQRSCRLIEAQEPKDLPRQLNYLIKSCAVRGDVVGAQAYIARREALASELVPVAANVYNILFFLIEQLRLHLTAWRGRHLEANPTPRITRAQLEQAAKLPEIAPYDQVLAGEQPEVRWLQAIVCRYRGGIAGTLGNQSEAQRHISRGIELMRRECEQESTANQSSYNLDKKVLFPLYAALWAEAALAGMETIVGGQGHREIPESKIRDLLTACGFDQFAALLTRPKLATTDLVRLTQTVHF